jgi:hypothetical protein
MSADRYQTILEKLEVRGGNGGLALHHWKTGAVLEEEFFSIDHKQRYGRNVINRLAEDLEVSTGFLYQVHRFFKAFPDFPEKEFKLYSSSLTWSHYRHVLSLAPPLRDLLLEEAHRDGLSPRELRERIKLHQKDPRATEKAQREKGSKQRAFVRINLPNGTVERAGSLKQDGESMEVLISKLVNFANQNKDLWNSE